MGLFRLKPGSDHLEREIEFRPLIPIPLKQSPIGNYLKREFQDFTCKIDEEGGVSVRLGPNQPLDPIASRIAYSYKKVLKWKKNHVIAEQNGKETRR